MQKWIILIVVCLIIILSIIVVINSNVETEYVPETEIEDRELRKTMINLYFQDKNSKQIVKETRLIDSKNLLRNPYVELLNMLVVGPENENYEKTIPEGTKVLETTLEGNILTINFSNEFVEKCTDDTQKRNSIATIVKTLTELTEVNEIKIIIEGNEIDGFTEIGLNFKENFVKKMFE